MSERLFKKLYNAIKHGKKREISEAIHEVKRAAARERPCFATVKLTAVYDSAEDCLVVHHMVDLGATEECIGIIGSAVLSPDGDTHLYANGALLDPHKHNKCATGCSIVHGLAHHCEGRSVTVHVCVLAVDACGKVTLISADQHVAIPARHHKL